MVRFLKYVAPHNGVNVSGEALIWRLGLLRGNTALAKWLVAFFVGDQEGEGKVVKVMINYNKGREWCKSIHSVVTFGVSYWRISP